MSSGELNAIEAMSNLILLFRVTRSHAKKLGEPLKLFIQKFASRWFLFITGEKKNTSFISILKIN